MEEKDETAQDFAGLQAHVWGLEKCINVIMATLLHHHPEMSDTMLDGFVQFARFARQENMHDQQVKLFDRMVAAIQRDRKI